MQRCLCRNPQAPSWQGRKTTARGTMMAKDEVCATHTRRAKKLELRPSTTSPDGPISKTSLQPGGAFFSSPSRCRTHSLFFAAALDLGAPATCSCKSREGGQSGNPRPVAPMRLGFKAGGGKLGMLQPSSAEGSEMTASGSKRHEDSVAEEQNGGRDRQTSGRRDLWWPEVRS